MLICKKCGLERSVGRRLCNSCYILYKREYSRTRNKQGKRTKYPHNCVICKKDFLGYRKTQLFCSQKCSKEHVKSKHLKNSYENGEGKGYCWKHRRIAEEVLGRKLNTNEVVHHVDCNPKNNRQENLMVMSRSSHGKLHSFLNKQRALWEQSHNGNSVNCWNNLIVPITTTWLETASVKVIKIWEIGQSAAKPL